jgi:hypothetical protein
MCARHPLQINFRASCWVAESQDHYSKNCISKLCAGLIKFSNFLQESQVRACCVLESKNWSIDEHEQ